jgi:ankyrin repeat protein
MKLILITTIAAVMLVGCTTTQPPGPPTAKAPEISIHKAAYQGNIEAVKQHIAAGTDVNAKDDSGWTPLHWAASKVHNKTAKLLIEEGADVNMVNKDGLAPLDYAENQIFGVLIDNGAKSGAELKAEGK